MRPEERHNNQFGRRQPDRSQASDEDPLLPAHSMVSNARPETTKPDPSPALATKLKRRTLILAALLILIVEMGNAMRIAPLIATYEDILCADTLPVLEGSQARCPDHSVASDLALILGVSQFLDCLPAALLSGLYGKLADRHGRRIVLCLSYFGVILSASWVTAVPRLTSILSLRFVWLGPAFTIIGGGPTVSTSILMASSADVVPDSQRASIFSLIHATALSAAILGSALGSVLMVYLNSSSALLVGLGIMCPVLFLAPFLPGTQDKADRDSTPPCDDIDSGHHDDSHIPAENSHYGDWLRKVREPRGGSSLWHTKGAVPLLISGFFSMLGLQVQILVIQYIPMRFNLSIAEANAFNVLNYVVNLVILFLVFPLASNLLVRRLGQPTIRKDLVLAHLSCALSIAGALILGLAPDVRIFAAGIVIFGTGISLSSLLRSIFVEALSTEHAAFAISSISAAKTVGGSLSGPVYSYAIAISVGMSGFFRGLPFLLSALFFVVVETTLARVGRIMLQNQAATS